MFPCNMLPVFRDDPTGWFTVNECQQQQQQKILISFWTLDLKINVVLGTINSTFKHINKKNTDQGSNNPSYQSSCPHGKRTNLVIKKKKLKERKSPEFEVHWGAHKIPNVRVFLHVAVVFLQQKCWIYFVLPRQGNIPINFSLFLFISRFPSSGPECMSAFAGLAASMFVCIPASVLPRCLCLCLYMPTS